MGSIRPVMRIGTRGSRLALAMTAQVTAALEARGVRCQVIPITTRGDRHPELPTIGLGAGAFVKDIEVALAEGRIDAAVHSAKDLHGEPAAGLLLTAFLPRGDPMDVLVSRDGLGLAALAEGAVVGTESPRRRAFLLAARPDLVVRGIRGNVDTRLRKLAAGEADAIVLAAAGLLRLGLGHHVTQRLEPPVMLPEAGQGAIVVQVRADAGEALRQCAPLDHAPTRAAVEAERAFVSALGGTCRSAIAAFATAADGGLTLEGAVLDPDGGRVIRDRLTGQSDHPEAVGHALAAKLADRGARTMLAGVGT